MLMVAYFAVEINGFTSFFEGLSYVIDPQTFLCGR